MSDAAFTDYALPWILRDDVEGGYSNQRNDRGGATNRGITIKLLELLPDGDNDGHLDGDFNRDGVISIADLWEMSAEDAADIYFRYFWKASGCGQLPVVMGLCLFDALVNHRPATARKLLQKALGVNTDGKIGPVTRKAAHDQYTSGNLEYFLIRYFAERAWVYSSIVASDSTQAKFLTGWYARLFRLLHYILETRHE